MAKNKNIKHSEIVKMAGASTFRKYGREHYSQMGKKGHETRMKKYGADYYRRIRKIGIEKQKKAKLSGVDKLADILNGSI